MSLSRFDASAWSLLAPTERVVQAHRMAEQFRTLSKNASGDLQRVYKELARAWDHLARQLERTYYVRLS
jgi:hypothetical protein